MGVGGLNCKSQKSKPKIGIRPNMVLEIFIFALKVRAFRMGEKEKRRRRKSRFGTFLLFGTLVSVSMEPMYEFVG